MSRRRWSLETCAPLHARWMKGETIRDMAREVGTGAHTLSRAFVRCGLPSPFDREHALTGRLKPRAAPNAGQCLIDLCAAVADHRGLCGRHYQMARRCGVVEDLAEPTRASVRLARAAQEAAHG